MPIPSDLSRVRQAHYELEHLPDDILIGKDGGNSPGAPLSIVDATVDDIAFALIAADQELSEAIARSSALKRLHQLARQAGGVGADKAVPMALKREAR